MNALAQQDFYLNSNQYTELKRDVRQNEEGANKIALQQFESLFITQMLKEMRSAAVVDEEQHSDYMDFYTDMYDKQLSTIMAKQGGIGIADQLEQQLADRDLINHKKDYSGGKFFPLEPDVAAKQGMPLQANANGMAFSAPHDVRELKQPDNLAWIRNELTPTVKKAEVLTQPMTAKPSIEKTALPEEFHEVQNTVDNSVVQLTALTQATKSGTSLIDEKIQNHQGWVNSSAFVQELMPQAQAVAKQLGVKPEVLVAQSALETGWGKHTMRHVDGSVSFSLFGIKADHRWTGDTVQVSTLEFKNGHMQKEMAQFRAYDSVGEAVQDYVNFIKSSTRYQSALSNSQDEAHYVKGLQKAGYATDPAYANKILNILQSDTLKQGIAAIESNREVV